MNNRKLRQKNHLETHFKKFKNAVSNEDIDSIASFGDKLIWNENLTQDQKEEIYQSIVELSNEPKLKKLWRDVHYKKHGYEPLD